MMKVKFTDSLLPPGLCRFLSQLFGLMVSTSLRTPKDVVEWFPVRIIMKSLEGSPDIRAIILTQTLHFPPVAGKHLSLDATVEVLLLALEHEETTPDDLIKALGPDNFATFLPADRLWACLTNNVDMGPTSQDAVWLATNMMVFGKENALITDQDIVEGIGIENLLKRPTAEDAWKRVVVPCIQRALAAPIGNAEPTVESVEVDVDDEQNAGDEEESTDGDRATEMFGVRAEESNANSKVIETFNILIRLEDKLALKFPEDTEEPLAKKLETALLNYAWLGEGDMREVMVATLNAIDTATGAKQRKWSKVSFDQLKQSFFAELDARNPLQGVAERLRAAQV